MTVVYKTADNLSKHSHILHGFFTRIGGASKGIYKSLNCGLGSDDKYENVIENRKRVAEALKAEVTNLFTPYQIHSNKVVVAETPWSHGEAPQADAIVTKVKGLGIAVLTADCGPILFSDDVEGIVGVAHSGWKGAFSGILENTIEEMLNLGASINNIEVAIGPLISQNAYEIGPEFKDNIVKDVPENRKFFKLYPSGKDHFDLAGYIKYRLQETGVKNIENLEICTVSNESEFFSYRRSVHKKEPDYGRQISVIGLK